VLFVSILSSIWKKHKFLIFCDAGKRYFVKNIKCSIRSKWVRYQKRLNFMLIPNLKTKLRNFESLVWSRSIFTAPAPVGPERAGSSSGSATPAMNMHLINIGESPASISIESIIGKCCSGFENICWIRVKN